MAKKRLTVKEHQRLFDRFFKLVSGYAIISFNIAEFKDRSGYYIELSHFINYNPQYKRKREEPIRRTIEGEVKEFLKHLKMTLEYNFPNIKVKTRRVGSAKDEKEDLGQV